MSSRLNRNRIHSWVLSVFRLGNFFDLTLLQKKTQKSYLKTTLLKEKAE